MRARFGLSSTAAQQIVSEAWRRHGGLIPYAAMGLVLVVLIALVLIAAEGYVVNGNRLTAATLTLIGAGQDPSALPY